MKYITLLSVITSCGDFGNTNIDSGTSVAVTQSSNKTEKNSSEENNREKTLAQSYTLESPEAPAITSSPIPALILPNNICIINTDLAPDRTIEEHILACVEAQRIRNTITR
tara:strand:+ start:423 stop:755 length:333 start_codon:yes stop_codon:yes gene_type:complete